MMTTTTQNNKTKTKLKVTISPIDELAFRASLIVKQYQSTLTQKEKNFFNRRLNHYIKEGNN